MKEGPSVPDNPWGGGVGLCGWRAVDRRGAPGWGVGVGSGFSPSPPIACSPLLEMRMARWLPLALGGSGRGNRGVGC